MSDNSNTPQPTDPNPNKDDQNKDTQPNDNQGKGKGKGKGQQQGKGKGQQQGDGKGKGNQKTGGGKGKQQGGGKGKGNQKTEGDANQKKPEDEEEGLGPNQYLELRKEMVLGLEKNYGMNPYPHKFDVSISVPDFHKKYNHFEIQQQDEAEIQSVAGRVRLIRNYGKKLIFIDIFQEGEKLQVLGNLQFYEDKELFVKFLDIIHKGDFIGVIGFPCRSKTGELSIIPKKNSTFISLFTYAFFEKIGRQRN